MTEGQQRYQNLMEQQRHNLYMERLGSRETAIKATEAETNQRKADIAAREQAVKEKSAKVENTMKTINTLMGVIGAIYPHTIQGKLESFGDQVLSGMGSATRTAVNASLFI